MKEGEWNETRSSFNNHPFFFLLGFPFSKLYPRSHTANITKKFINSIRRRILYDLLEKFFSIKSTNIVVIRELLRINLG